MNACLRRGVCEKSHSPFEVAHPVLNIRIVTASSSCGGSDNTRCEDGLSSWSAVWLLLWALVICWGGLLTARAASRSWIFNVWSLIVVNSIWFSRSLKPSSTDFLSSRWCCSSLPTSLLSTSIENGCAFCLTMFDVWCFLWHFLGSGQSLWKRQILEMTQDQKSHRAENMTSSKFESPKWQEVIMRAGQQWACSLEFITKRVE